MPSAGFDYHTAETVDGALDLLEAHPDARILASGHGLLPGTKTGLPTPEAVVDVTGIDAIDGIEYDGGASIGAATTYADVERAPQLRNGARELTEAIGEIADAQVRNRATIGGNLARPHRVSDLSPAVVAAGATLVAAGRDGERRIDAEAFFLAMHTTDLGEGELLTRIEVPLADGDGSGAYVKSRSRTSRYTLLGVAVRLETDDGVVSTARVAANGVVDHAVRLPPVEAVLEGERLDRDAVDAAAARATAGLDRSAMVDDEEASAAYRARRLEVDVARALERAGERAGVTVAT